MAEDERGAKKFFLFSREDATAAGTLSEAAKLAGRFVAAGVSFDDALLPPTAVAPSKARRALGGNVCLLAAGGLRLPS